MNILISQEELKNIFVEYARNSDGKLSFIFGAGASAGYSRDEDYLYKPPVVSELLQEDNFLVDQVLKKDEHKNVKTQKSHIKRSIENIEYDLEAYLSSIYNNDKNDNTFPSMLRYLEDIFSLASVKTDLEDNNYQALYNRTRDLRGPRKWSLISFNYDTVLEQSIASLPRHTTQRNFISDDNYLNINPTVLKVHGGVNFRYISFPKKEGKPTFHQVFTEMMEDNSPVNSYLDIISPGSPLPLFSEYDRFKKYEEKYTYNFPLMMIPVHTEIKNMNSFFNRQIEYAKNEISESKLVIAIGYQFGDNTFLETLKEIDLSDSLLILVGTGNLISQLGDSRAYKAASKVWPKEKIRIFDGDGFGTFVKSIY